MIQVFFLFFVVICFALFSRAEDLSLKISFAEDNEVFIYGEIPALRLRKVSFLKDYAGFSQLNRRFKDIRFFGKGYEVFYKEISPGVFAADEEIASFSYRVDLSVDEKALIASISWIKESLGLLSMNDLVFLELQGQSARISFEVPEEWKIFSNEERFTEKIFLARKLGSSIFLIGKSISSRSFYLNGKAFELVFAGEWKFNEEAIASVREIFSWYQDKIGRNAFSKIHLFFVYNEQSKLFNKWSAETRNGTILIISSPSFFDSNAMNLFNEQIRHELLHLWIPNSLNLKGSYDWFFEGFIVYYALKTGVLLGQIRFDDYLSAISNALNLSKKKRISMIEASLRRWYDSNDIVYSKGLIVAFLFDLELSQKDRSGLENLFRRLIRQHGSSTRGLGDGNTTVIKMLSEIDAVLVKRYVEGSEEVDLKEKAGLFGIEVGERDGKIYLQVSKSLSDRQKELLERLGYNRRIQKNLRQMRKLEK